MSESKNPTNLPREGAEIRPQSYRLGLQFHPAIRLDKRVGLEFAAALSDHVDTENVELESTVWRFVFGKSDESLYIKRDGIEFHCSKPDKPQERYESRYKTILDRFSEKLEPKVILASQARIEGLLDIDGDARDFLANSVMDLKPRNIGAFKRPVHSLGLRLQMPPFQVEDENTGSPVPHTDWGADVDVSSWFQNPSKLLISVDAFWPNPQQWDDKGKDAATSRLQTVDGFVKGSISEFLSSVNENGGD